MSLRVGILIIQENNPSFILNELLLLHPGNFQNTPVKHESKIIHKLFI